MAAGFTTALGLEMVMLWLGLKECKKDSIDYQLIIS
jgi:hypothetical protein